MTAPIAWGDEPEQTEQPRGPIEWARQQQAERVQACGCGDAKPHATHRYMRLAAVWRCPGATEQPARHTADTITDNALNQLYARIDYLAGYTATLEAYAAEQRQLGEQAETAIARARAYADRLDQLAAATISAGDRTVYHGIATDLRAKLDESKETRP